MSCRNPRSESRQATLDSPAGTFSFFSGSDDDKARRGTLRIRPAFTRTCRARNMSFSNWSGRNINSRIQTATNTSRFIHSGNDYRPSSQWQKCSDCPKLTYKSFRIDQNFQQQVFCHGLLASLGSDLWMLCVVIRGGFHSD